jgi:hypothetical protein
MAITKKDVVEKIDVSPNSNHISVRIAHTVMEDDEEIGRSIERRAFLPDGDWSNEDAQVIAVCDAVFTDAVKTQWAKDNADKPV